MRDEDRCELTQDFHLHRLLRRVVVLIFGRAGEGALVALSLDVLDGETAIRDTLSHICGQFDIIFGDERRKDEETVHN